MNMEKEYDYIIVGTGPGGAGVIINGDPHWDPENLEVDLEATRKLRQELRRNPPVKGVDYLERRKGPEGYQG